MCNLSCGDTGEKVKLVSEATVDTCIATSWRAKEMTMESRDVTYYILRFVFLFIFVRQLKVPTYIFSSRSRAPQNWDTVARRGNAPSFDCIMQQQRLVPGPCAARNVLCWIQRGRSWCLPGRPGPEETRKLSLICKRERERERERGRGGRERERECVCVSDGRFSLGRIYRMTRNQVLSGKTADE